MRGWVGASSACHSPSDLRISSSVAPAMTSWRYSSRSTATRISVFSVIRSPSPFGFRGEPDRARAEQSAQRAERLRTAERQVDSAAQAAAARATLWGRPRPACQHAADCEPSEPSSGRRR